MVGLGARKTTLGTRNPVAMKRRSRWILKNGKVTPHILEEDVVEEITRRLWWQYKIRMWRIRERIPGHGPASMAGIPDLIGWLPGGRFLGIECKRPGGAKRIAQIQFISDAKSDGCVAFFADCWDNVVRELDEQCGLKLKEVA